jgi:ribosomal protein L12E/L44/L45/RPP1/RPP2
LRHTSRRFRDKLRLIDIAHPLPFRKKENHEKKLVILFVAAFTSIFGAVACGGEADVQQAEQEVKEAEQNVEEAEQEEKQEKQEEQQGQDPEAD